MFRFKHKNTKRIVTAICLLLIITFTSLYATFQNGQDFNAAYASSSSNNCGWWDAACVAALAASALACATFNPACPALVIAAAATCATADNCD